MREPHSSSRTTVPSVFGGVVRSLRGDLRQAEFAQALGLTQSGWSRIERGETAIGLDQLFLVAQVLGMQPSELLQMTERALGDLQSRGYEIVAGRLPPKEPSAGAAFLAGAALTALIGTLLQRD